jgi:hypothetical protein
MLKRTVIKLGILLGQSLILNQLSSRLIGRDMLLFSMLAFPLHVQIPR